WGCGSRRRCRSRRGGSRSRRRAGLPLLGPVRIAQTFLRHRLGAAFLRAGFVARLAEGALPPHLIVRLAVTLRAVGVLAPLHLALVLLRRVLEVCVLRFGLLRVRLVGHRDPRMLVESPTRKRDRGGMSIKQLLLT